MQHGGGNSLAALIANSRPEFLRVRMRNLCHAPRRGDITQSGYLVNRRKANPFHVRILVLSTKPPGQPESAIRTSDLITTTRLLPGRTRLSADDRICSVLEGIPNGDQSDTCLQRVGILNLRGEVYREVIVTGAFALLNLTARLNAIGLRITRRSDGRSRYSALFSARSDHPNRDDGHTSDF